MYSHFFTTSFVYILSLFVFFCQMQIDRPVPLAGETANFYPAHFEKSLPVQHLFSLQILLESSPKFHELLSYLFENYPKGGNRFWPETTAYEGEII